MRQRVEKYVPDLPTAEPAEPHCVISGCGLPVDLEVHCDDYAAALEMFRGIRRRKVRTRRQGDERFFICEQHLASDPRMRRLRRQEWMFPEGGQR